MIGGWSSLPLRARLRWNGYHRARRRKAIIILTTPRLQNLEETGLNHDNGGKYDLKIW